MSSSPILNPLKDRSKSGFLQGANRPNTDNYTENALHVIAITNQKIQDRIAPDNATMQIVKANKAQHTAGVIVASLSLQGPFNTIVASLQSGQIGVYFGPPNGQPDLIFAPSDNPIIVPLGRRTDPVVTILVMPNSQPAQGSILLEYY